jgi:hypothetical protein
MEFFKIKKKNKKILKFKYVYNSGIIIILHYKIWKLYQNFIQLTIALFNFQFFHC